MVLFPEPITVKTFCEVEENTAVCAVKPLVITVFPVTPRLVPSKVKFDSPFITPDVPVAVKI